MEYRNSMDNHSDGERTTCVYIFGQAPVLKDDQYNSVGAVWQTVSIELSGYTMRHMLLVSAKERLGSPWVENSGAPCVKPVRVGKLNRAFGSIP